MGKMNKEGTLCQMENDQNLRGVGQSPALLPQGTAWMLRFSIYGALYSGIMQQPPTISFCFKTCNSLALPDWDGPLDGSAQVCEFREINTQKSKNCGISPLNAVPREGVCSLTQH